MFVFYSLWQCVSMYMLAAWCCPEAIHGPWCPRHGLLVGAWPLLLDDTVNIHYTLNVDSQLKTNILHLCWGAKSTHALILHTLTNKSNPDLSFIIFYGRFLIVASCVKLKNCTYALWFSFSHGLQSQILCQCPRCHLNEGFYIVLFIACWSKYLWDWSLLCYYYPYIVQHDMTTIWSAVFRNVMGYSSHFEFPVMAIGKQLATVSKDNLPFDQSCSRH